MSATLTTVTKMAAGATEDADFPPSSSEKRHIPLECTTVGDLPTGRAVIGYQAWGLWTIGNAVRCDRVRHVEALCGCHTGSTPGALVGDALVEVCLVHRRHIG